MSENTTYAPYSFRSTKGSSRVRNYDADSDKTYELFTSTAQDVDDIIEALLGAPTDNWDIWGMCVQFLESTKASFAFLPATDPSVCPASSDPLWHEDGKVISWVGFWGIPDSVFDGQTLLPQGIYMKFDITGRDPSKWEFLGCAFLPSPFVDL